ncbi:MAG: proline dehydrogenase family protein [bacterium]
MLSRLLSWMLPAVPRRAVQRVASRYISGDTAESAIALSAALAAQGFVTTIDVLGEDTTTLEQARAAATEYVELMEAMARAGVERNVSLKLSQLGLRVDGSRAFDELRRVLDGAAGHDFFVRIDMEDSSVTDQTLELYRRAREHWPRVGTVLQSRLRRTVDDARQLADEGANVRLCKGIYREHRSLAYRRRGEIRSSYLEAARALLAGRTHAAFATHDLPLLEQVRSAAAELRPNGQGFEFQALLGVPIRSSLEALRDQGYPVRLYVPFGKQWYAYSVRRLRENPQLAGAIVRGLFSRDRMDAGTVHSRPDAVDPGAPPAGP